MQQAREALKAAGQEEDHALLRVVRGAGGLEQFDAAIATLLPKARMSSA